MIGVGIDAVGLAVPRLRLTRDAVRRSGWDVPAGWNCSTVAEPDEDPLTLAIEACLDGPVGRFDAEPVHSLGLASTTLPYRRRVQAGLIVDALGLPAGILVTEHTTSARAGTEALLTHGSQVAVRGKAALVVAAEAPAGPGRGVDESSLAVALRLGQSGDFARVDAVACRLAEYPGLDFQGADEPSRRDVQVPDYSSDAYTTLLRDAATTVLTELGTDASAFRTVVLAGVTPALAGKGAALLGLSAGQWRSAMPYLALGDAGAAGAIFGLVHAVDQAEPGDRILLVSYGAGSALDMIALTAGPAAGRRVLADRLTGFVDLDFAQFLRRRGG